MKPGDSFLCPSCGHHSFLKKEAVMDGWTKVGDVLKCVSCGAVAERQEQREAEPQTEESVTAGRTDALAALLGGETPAPKPVFDRTRAHFCRDCAFRVANAFRMRCMKHDKDVNPMDDCPDFRVRPDE